MIAMLDCRHVVRLPDWPADAMRCYSEGCFGMRRVIAIESREWKVTCNGECRYARWFGQDQSGANVKANLHKHSCMVDYLKHPATEKRIRRDYRRVKRIIPGMGGILTVPAYSRQSELPDEPPF